MSILMNEYRGMMSDLAKKYKDPSLSQEMSFPVSYPTSILPLDYMNGIRSYITELDRDITYNYDSIGVEEGSIVMLVGKPGCGKTSLAIQAATSIARRYPESIILHEDAEGGTSIPRILSLSGWTTRELIKQYSPRNSGINSDSFFERVNSFCQKKIELAEQYPEELKYFTGIIDYEGKPVYKLVPSFVILDSLAMLGPKGMTEEEKLAGNMSAAQVAKLNKQVFVRLAQPLKQANVIMFIVNHLNQNISINPFAPKSAQTNYLSADESIPGGTTPLYLSNNVFKLTPSIKLTADKDFGINGFIIKNKMIKSRTNRAGQEVSLVYDQTYGFDRTYTCYQMLKDQKLVHGSGAWFYLEGMPQVKFQQKAFKSKLEDSIMLRQCFRELSVYACEQLLNNSGAGTVIENEADLEKIFMDSLDLEKDFGELAC